MMRNRKVFAVTAALTMMTGMVVSSPNDSDAHTLNTTVSLPCTAYPNTSLAGPTGTAIELIWHGNAPDTVEPGTTFSLAASIDPVAVPTESSG